ncbi:hypothetical protein ACO0SA_000960 [Hanseniaspora valbyensis]
MESSTKKTLAQINTQVGNIQNEEATSLSASSNNTSNTSNSYIQPEQFSYSVASKNDINEPMKKINDNTVIGNINEPLTLGKLSIKKVMKMFIKNRLFFNERGIIVKDMSTLPDFKRMKKEHFDKQQKLVKSNINTENYDGENTEANDDTPFSEEVMQEEEYYEVSSLEDDEDDDDDDETEDALSIISCMSCLSTNSLRTLDHPEERNKLLNNSNNWESVDDILEQNREGNCDNENMTLEPGVEKVSHGDLQLKTVELPNNSIIPFRKILNCKVLNWNEYKNLDIEIKDFDFIVEIIFAKNRRTDVIPRSSIIRCSLDEYFKILKMCGSLEDDEQPTLKELILFKSFPNPVERNKVLVIINPNGGKGKAHKIFHSKSKPILLASNNTQIHIKETTYHREAYHFVKNHPNLLKYNIICCASGDGIPHEVLNAIYHRPDRMKIFQELVISQIPCGSGNALSLSCHGTSNASLATLNILKGRVEQMDLMTVQQPSYKDNLDNIDDETTAHNTRVSFLSQAYGIIAESDINTEYLRFLGPSRFEIGVTAQVLRKKKYPCDVMVKFGKDSKQQIKQHYLDILKQKTEEQHSGSGIYDEELMANVYTFDGKQEFKQLNEKDMSPQYYLDQSSVNDLPDSEWCYLDSQLTKNLNIFYGGKMPYIAPDCKFFPAAIHNDSFIDLVISDSKTSITRMASILLNLDKGDHVIQPEVTHLKVEAFRLIPHVAKSVISVDGEKFPLEPMQCEVLSKICKMVFMEQGGFKETGFEVM